MENNICPFCMKNSTGDICENCKKSKSEYKGAAHFLPPGTILNGKYITGAVLGAGGFGITYIGLDTALDMKIAIKEYFPTGAVTRNTEVSADVTAFSEDTKNIFESGKAKFLTEARTLAKFSNEPNIVWIRDFFSENNTTYIVMEYIEGITLTEHIEKNGKMSFDAAVEMISPVISALSRIHGSGLTHRDISPDNIMMSSNGQVKLLDFGSSREINETNEKTMSVMLKPGYAPEEQYRTKGVQGAWTDVYSISATLYKMLTATTPVDAMNRVFSDDIKKISDLNPTVTPSQEEVIMKGMAVSSKDRFQNMDALLSALNHATGTRHPVQNVQPVQHTVPIYDTPPVRQTAPTYEKPLVQQTPPAEKITQSEAKTKKPNIAGLIFSVIFGLLAAYMFLGAIAVLGEFYYETSELVVPCIIGVLFAGISVLFGRIYFPRLDNKNRKPNKLCFGFGIFTSIIALFWIIMFISKLVNKSSGLGEPAFAGFMAVIFIGITAFFDYFYYPRLERKKKNLFAKIYGGSVAGIMVIFLFGMIFGALNSVTVGDQNIKRSEKNVSLGFDVINNNDIEKLKELKNLESLTVTSSFLDNEDVEIISEITWLKTLNLCNNTDITDASSLKKLTNLEELNLSITNISDISFISEMPKLTAVDISHTKVTDVTLFGSLEALERLNISYTPVNSDTIQLSTTVESLACDGCGLSNIGFISGLENLTSLSAAHNSITDLSPMTNLSKVTSLNLANNKISDISSISALPLTDIDLSVNKISDIGALRGIDSLNYVSLDYNSISDLSPLDGKSHLYTLSLNHNNISDISPIKDCFRMYLLDLSYNTISDISALTTIDDLYMLNLRSNSISDISPLGECKKLIDEGDTLDLRNNVISDISVLSEFTNTKHIYLSDNNISDISPLKNCTALEMLRINNNNISDISPIYSTGKLHILEVVNNPIENVDGLMLTTNENSVFEDASLHISYNENIDFKKLSETENLSLCVYDVPDRKTDELMNLGILSYASDLLDIHEENKYIKEYEEETDV